MEKVKMLYKTARRLYQASKYGGGALTLLGFASAIYGDHIGYKVLIALGCAGMVAGMSFVIAADNLKPEDPKTLEARMRGEKGYDIE